MPAEQASPIVIVGMACRVPGAESIDAFADLLFSARTGYQELPSDRCDRTLYFDPQKGQPGKSYTTLGGTVPERPLDRVLCPLSEKTERLFDTAHVQFAEVAATAWRNAELVPHDTRLARTGMYVGHSGGTKSGGGLSLGTQIEEAVSFLDDIDAFQQLPATVRRGILAEILTSIRRDRPSLQHGALPCFQAYQAASLAARVLGLTGPRAVVDAACASSLVALAQAMMAIRTGRIDSAVVGGATYNNIDNLILFSHSQACTATDSRPFDDHASGLVSSEGYAAIVIMTQDQAVAHDLPILGVIRGVGMASDGKGRSLWAPRMEGQILALQRAYGGIAPLDIDYLEAHATSTQLGDATELETLRQFSQYPQSPLGQHQLLVGSVKSNIGHTLEAAGLIGLIKVLISMHRRRIPPSLRYETPNHNYDWATAPVRVVAHTEPWPERALHLRPRRAAVSAFGIGGLNAHVVIEEAGQGGRKFDGVTRSSLSTHRPLPPSEPIAIVGRGIIVAGAKNLADFKLLLESDRSALSDAPADRWRQRTGVTAGNTAETHHTPHCHGGFITDFSFDGSKYAIPPKQVQQANPVQLMLIDAVAQALADVNSMKVHGGTDTFPVDRQRIGVVIGSIFGGEFGDQLQVGLRLPEICRHLTAAIQRRGLPDQLSQQLASEFRRIVLRNRPALLDETGSFTASTLASRVAKVFDLMGGACALDSDNTSGLTALAVAADQLRSGACDMIICGSAQRSMSLSAFESLDMNDQLVRSGRSEDVPDDCHQILPGEGVVALMLCRLSDAKKLDLTIHGILGDVVQQDDSVTHVTQLSGKITTVLEGRPTEVLTSADARIIRRIGYLAGSHSLIRITAETLSTPHEPHALAGQTPITIGARTSDGVVLHVPLSIPIPPGSSEIRKHFDRSSYSSPINMHAPPSLTSAVVTPTNMAIRTPLQSVRFAATSAASLLQLLKNAHDGVVRVGIDHQVFREAERAGSASCGFNRDDQFRAMILFASADQLPQRLAAAAKAVESGKLSTVLDRERVILWQTRGTAPRVAWLFPGQGSHYPETPDVLSTSEIARRTIAEVDELCAASNLPRLSTAFDNAAIRPGGDVWWAQAWVLGVSAALTRALTAEGLRPDAVLGHSFGEFTASLAADVITLPQAIELAKHRANAVISHMRTPGGLLSIRAAVHEVDAILKSAGLAVYVTHLNSTKQTVIAGSRDGIHAAKLLLDKHGLASMSVAVPAPFHTPFLADAEVAFDRMSAGVSMRPPVCGFLSATGVQYLAEPSGIRSSMVHQLTQPVMYMPSIQRMLSEGYHVFLEVGPNDVLTRMNRDIVDGRALCLSLDVPGQPYAERIQLVHAALECAGSAARAPGYSVSSGSGAPIDVTRQSEDNTISPGRAAAEVVFDVTRSGRAGRKSSQSIESASQVSGMHLPTHKNDKPTDDDSHRWSQLTPTVRPLNSASTTAGISDSQLRSFVLDLVVELTGYTPDVVDFDADLEADLGIDSIKKAQILGETGVWMGLTVRPDGLRFDSVRTLADAIRTVRTLAGQQQTSADPDPSASVPRSSGSTASEDFIPPAEVGTVALSINSQSIHRRGSLPANTQLDAMLIDYVVDQTGYAPGIVDLDADLEADLGLDSIKLAQLIGEMREQFNLESLTLESMGQKRFRTLRDIREFLVQHAASGAASAPQYNDIAGAPVFSPGLISRPAPQYSDQDGTKVASCVNPTVRGTEPHRGITPEWSQWFCPGNSQPASVDAALQIGVHQGRQHRTKIRSALRTLVNQQAVPVANQDWNAIETAQFAGVAVGAGVAESSVRFAAAVVRDRLHITPAKPVPVPDKSAVRSDADDVIAESAAAPRTRRFALRVVPAPRRAGMPTDPELHGAALILGENILAESLADRVRCLGQKAFVVSTEATPAQLEKTLAEIQDHTPVPHLFLTMAHDADSVRNLTVVDWKHRRQAALEVPFRICQLWMQQTIDSHQMENASVVAVTQLGGDFGFSGQQVQSVEAIGGLVKAMLIEAWMRGFRTTPMKVIDLALDIPPEVSARAILQELAVPSYDMEVAFRFASDPPAFPKLLSTNRKVRESAADIMPERWSVQAVAAPLTATLSATGKHAKPRITRGGTWIVSGGGRGITAAIAMTLAQKYDLKLHLLGTAPVPNLTEDFVQRVASDRGGVRNRIMQEAAARGESPVEAWRNTEKAIEVDATLRDCRRQGITATYHCCDVADFSKVEAVAAAIRRQDGQIRGVIHGAGAGQDARFDRKRPDKVEKCLRAKVDATFALMQATESDPLEWFAAFGSISGRFGANGHTDYSLANDMMAKIVDRYRSQRPEVRSVTFHWHAWGDIGMATKPEARLALEMIDMEFMPARDGVAHFMRELELGGDEPEVLITDESYFRRFFPAERLSLATDRSGTQPLPLLSSTATPHGDGVFSSIMTLNPVSDQFLSQHRVQNRPTLPFVVALELMAEAVRARTGMSDVGLCTQAVAKQSIRFSSDDPLAVTLQTRVTRDGAIECRLLADVRRRDGRMVEEDREYFRAVFPLCERKQIAASDGSDFRHLSNSHHWEPIKYGSTEGLIYHGPELQELRSITDDGQVAFGRIAASAPVQLFGSSRTRGFTVPCATMDACLYAVGYTAWRRFQKPSLPVQFGEIEFGRMPDPGEPCIVRIQQKHVLESGATWDFQLQGHNGDRLLTVTDYQIGWLKGI